MNKKAFSRELDICLNETLKPNLEKHGFLKAGKYKFERYIDRGRQVIEFGIRVPPHPDGAVAYLFVWASISFPEIETLAIELAQEKAILNNPSPAFKFISGTFPRESGLKEWRVTDLSHFTEICQTLSDYTISNVFYFLESVFTCEDAADLISNNSKSMVGIRSYNSSVIISSATLITAGRIIEAQKLVRTVFLGNKGLEQRYSNFLRNMEINI